MKKWYWAIPFLVIIGLSMDFWQWDNQVMLGWLGLPSWIFYYMILHILWVITFYLFAKRVWKSDL